MVHNLHLKNLRDLQAHRVQSCYQQPKISTKQWTSGTDGTDYQAYVEELKGSSYSFDELQSDTIAMV
jgi:hypothetical protein